MDTPNPPMPPDDERLIEQFRRHYAPPPRTAAQRVMLRESLEARLHRSAVPHWLAMAAATCAAAVALWLVVPRPATVRDATPAMSGDVLAAYALDEDSAGNIDDLLPPDYAAIQSILDL
jgi:hypothetical protein